MPIGVMVQTPLKPKENIMPTPVELLLDPVSLTVFALYAGLIA